MKRDLEADARTLYHEYMHALSAFVPVRWEDLTEPYRVAWREVAEKARNL